ncbi:hypothetical protein [Brevibacillus brevis]|uniref:hypothetical protein n=1 Tax=Brevibacillus brevis TaxID=1393 RepID=UPI00115A68CA|nr:hypothetical protein [Lysinibacillus sp. SDF0063]TQR38513.1 hypothetical protein C7Y45_00115 [Lysinibacillus sp. SDF0063]
MFNHILKDIGERGTALSLDLGERPYLFGAGERGQFLCTDPEWRLQDGPGWEMQSTGPDWEAANFDGGPGWQMYGPPEWGCSSLVVGPPDGWRITVLPH